MPLPVRRHSISQRILIVSGLAAACVAAPEFAHRPIAVAQGWDPFSQLETNRWERRPAQERQPSRRSDESDAALPSASDGPRAAPSPYGTPDPARDAYLDPPDRRPRFGDPQQTYYPPPRTDLPAYGAGRAAPAAPASIRSEPLAPLPGVPPASQPGPATTDDRGYSPATAPAMPPARGQPVDLAVRRGSPGGAVAGLQTGLPGDLWRGLDLPAAERLMGSLDLPPGSPAVHDLWRRLLVSDAAPPAGTESSGHFQALRLEALYRSGLLNDIRQTLTSGATQATSDPLIAMLAARSEIGLGRRNEGCETVKQVQNIRGEIPKSLRGEAILVAGYCAAATGNKPAAGLLAELAREEGIRPSPGLAALDAVGLGIKTDIALAQGQKLALIDYRILELAGATPQPGELVKMAAPALLVALADDSAAAADLRLAAGEAAARINAYAPDALAALYRAAAGSLSSRDAPVDSNVNGADTPQRRALLFASAEAERTPFKKVRFIRAFIDSAKRGELYLPSLIIAAKLTDAIGLVPEIGWFAETAIEANLGAANYERARMWAKFAASIDTGRGQSLDHWMALIDIADPNFPERRGDSLAELERLALMGRFSSEHLHRLATVLDALQYNVPIPLWEAASRTPQPTTGHLPQTGVLSQLQDAAKKREFARTVLLAMQTLGPNGAEGAHMIALGDAIRALMRAGLESDARRLGFEALLAGWPRVVTN